MKLVNQIRFLLQLFSFLSIFFVIGSFGAWETGSIQFSQLIVQIFMFAGIGLFCGKMSKKRIVIRIGFKKRRRLAAQAQTNVVTAHAM
ncbi:hypothetical protein V6615_12890 [Oscillospiraceae bacterium PP1C4]